MKDTVTIRIDRDVYNYLKEEAEKDDRSIRSLIKSMLRESFKPSRAVKEKPKVTRFKKPEKADVFFYIRENNYNVDVEKWFSHYEANGWKVGKNPMKDWQAAVRTWHKPITDIPKPHNQFSAPQDEVYTEPHNIVKQEPINKEEFYARAKKEAEEKRNQGPPTEEEKAKGRANLLRDVILGKNNGRR